MGLRRSRCQSIENSTPHIFLTLNDEKVSSLNLFPNIAGDIYNNKFLHTLKIGSKFDIVTVKCPYKGYRHHNDQDIFGDYESVKILFEPNSDILVEWKLLTRNTLGEIVSLFCGNLKNRIGIKLLNLTMELTIFADWRYNVRWKNAPDTEKLATEEK
uniref:TMV resistance protein N-like n=1 Tax=Strongyloides venezuelensis TaxID=75913 RepID=A0A0K0FM49_STRVS